MFNKQTPLTVLVWLLGVSCFAQTPSSVTHTVGSGDSLYSLVAEYYPERLANWTDVAADVVAQNPDAFPEGLDTVLKLGDVLTLVEYGSGPPRSGYATTEPSAADERSIETATDTPDDARATSSEPVVPVNSGTIDDTIDDNTGGAIGRVMSVSDNSTAIDRDNQQRPIALNDYVYLGDALTTSTTARVTVRLLDESELTLFPSSRVMFERYQFGDAPDQGDAVLTLVKGGFRMKTGKLGQRQPAAIAVNTAVATVSVQGTEFALRVCAPDSCRVTSSSDKLAAGLYSGVLEGVIVLSNNTGNVQNRRGEFFHVAAPNAAPQAALQAAGLLFEHEELTLMNVKIEEERPLSFFGWLKRKVFGD